jgi:transketolase
MSLWRPADATETAVAWSKALQRVDGPTSIALSRQAVPHLPKNAEQVQHIARGGYILLDCERIPDAIIIGTGSEVSLALKAAKALSEEGYQIRVVSMPSTDVFQLQDRDYRETVLPATVKQRVVVEAAATNYWYQWVGFEGAVVGIDCYGESAPGEKIFTALNLTVDAVIAKTKVVLQRKKESV